VDGELRGCQCSFIEQDIRECREGLEARCREIASCQYRGEPSRELFDAAIRGDAETVGPLVAPLEGQALERAGGPLLRIAVYMGYLELVTVLLDAGVPPDVPDENGKTALLLAPRPLHEGIGALLLSRGADPNQQWSAGITPLIAACYDGDLEGARLLLELGADPNARTTQTRNSPLVGAALGGHVELIELLLESGADPSLKNAGGQTASATAASRGHARAVEVLERGR
jgi:hypothetical protein